MASVSDLPSLSPRSDVFAGAHGGFENFNDCDAAGVVDLGNEALGDDEAERFGEAGADGLLIGERKDADDAFDGFGRVDGVKSGENQVAGFGGFESDFDGFFVAHFADQNDLGRLAQGGAQGERETWRVAVKFALVNRGFLVAVQEFDGVLNGEDVIGLFLVDLDLRWRRAWRIFPSRLGRSLGRCRCAARRLW